MINRPKLEETKPQTSLTTREELAEEDNKIVFDDVDFPDPSPLPEKKREYSLPWYQRTLLKIAFKKFVEPKIKGKKVMNDGTKSWMLTISKVVIALAGFLGITIPEPTTGQTEVITMITVLIYAALGVIEKYFLKQEVKEVKKEVQQVENKVS